MSDTEEKKPSAFDVRLREGRPLMECVIDPPFTLEFKAAGMQLDAPCLQFNHTDSLGVLRLTFTAMAAMQLRDALNQVQFAEVSSPGSSTLQ